MQLQPSETSQFEHMKNLPSGGLRKYDEVSVGPQSRRRNTNREGEQQPALIPARRCASPIRVGYRKPDLRILVRAVPCDTIEHDALPIMRASDAWSVSASDPVAVATHLYEIKPRTTRGRPRRTHGR